MTISVGEWLTSNSIRSVLVISYDAGGHADIRSQPEAYRSQVKYAADHVTLIGING